MRIRVLLLAALALASAGGALGNLDATCAYEDSKKYGKTSSGLPKDWYKNRETITGGTLTYLSGCQTTSMKMSGGDTGIAANTPLAYRMLIGGKGGAEIVGINAGGDSGGCTSATACLQKCQALCCLAQNAGGAGAGCTRAVIREEKKTKDYVVYKETEYKWYCSLYKGGSTKGSDVEVTCTVSGTDRHCAAIAQTAMGMNETSYNQILGLAPYATCPTSGRRLLQQPASSTVTVSEAKLQEKLTKAFAPFTALKNNLLAMKNNGTMGNRIKNSGICNGTFVAPPRAPLARPPPPEDPEDVPM